MFFDRKLLILTSLSRDGCFEIRDEKLVDEMDIGKWMRVRITYFGFT